MNGSYLKPKPSALPSAILLLLVEHAVAIIMCRLIQGRAIRDDRFGLQLSLMDALQ